MKEELNIEEYNLLAEMLHTAFCEMKDMSKKSPNDVLKSLKVKAINRILMRSKELFKNESSIDFLDLLDDEELPTTSDTILVMSQYVAAFKVYYSKYNSMTGFGSKLKKTFY